MSDCHHAEFDVGYCTECGMPKSQVVNQDLHDEIKRLKGELAEEESQKLAEVRKVETARKECVRLRDELAAAETDAEHYKIQWNEAKAEIEPLKVRLSNARAMVQIVKDQAGTMSAEEQDDFDKRFREAEARYGPIRTPDKQRSEFELPDAPPETEKG